MTSPRTFPSRTGRDSLFDRAQRIERVLIALRDRDLAHRAAGGSPPPLRAAITDFGVELGRLRRRVSQLPH